MLKKSSTKKRGSARSRIESEPAYLGSHELTPREHARAESYLTQTMEAPAALRVFVSEKKRGVTQVAVVPEVLMEAVGTRNPNFLVGILKQLGRLMDAENILQQDSAERGFNKLARTFVAQIEGLKRYRNGDREQAVRVEHVTVKNGGQAIVGNVSHGGKESSKNEKATP